MSVEPYDFRKPAGLRAEVKKRLTAWFQAAGALAAKKGARTLPFPVECRFAGLDVLDAAEALRQLPEPAVAHRVDIEPGGPATLFVLPRPLALALAGGALGDTAAQLPEDRELSVVEENLYSYLLQHLFLDALRETWTAGEPIALKAGANEAHPRWSRLFAPREPLAVCTYTLTGPFGARPVSWLLPRQGMLGRLFAAEATPEPPPPPKAEVAARLEALVRGLPVTLSVVLGGADLPLAQLSRLREGDVIVLDQRVNQPLAALVSGGKKYLGYVGRVGPRQAFQIERRVG